MYVIDSKLKDKRICPCKQIIPERKKSISYHRPLSKFKTLGNVGLIMMIIFSLHVKYESYQETKIVSR